MQTKSVRILGAVIVAGFFLIAGIVVYLNHVRLKDIQTFAVGDLNGRVSMCPLNGRGIGRPCKQLGYSTDIENPLEALRGADLGFAPSKVKPLESHVFKIDTNSGTSSTCLVFSVYEKITDTYYFKAVKSDPKCTTISSYIPGVLIYKGTIPSIEKFLQK